MKYLSSPLLAKSALVMVLSGCTMIPDYMRPSLPVPDSWFASHGGTDAPADKTTAEEEIASIDTVTWDKFFTDPVLQGLIQAGLDNNRDLRVATLNVAAAQAAHGIQRADLFPSVEGGASETAVRVPRRVSSTGQTLTSREYDVNLASTAYELDLFGRVRSLDEKALEGFFATQEAQAAARISLIGAIAKAYIAYLGDRKMLALTEDTLKSREDTHKLVKLRFDNGIATELDLAQARSTVESARVSHAQYVRQIAQDENALALLVGKPLDIALLTEQKLDDAHFNTTLPVGLPSAVLLARPDVMAAEHSLKAANANIGAARAAFFPSISLTGTYGTASPSLDALFASGTTAWTFVPQITLPIFEGGRNMAALKGAEVNREIAVATYEKAIQTAFAEVSDALASREALADQVKAQHALVEATQTSYTLSKDRFDRGLDSFLTVLDSQRSLFSAQEGLVVSKVSALSNLVGLYQALGGGRD